MAIVLAVAGVAGAAPQPALADVVICFVDADATGGGDTGANWTNAYVDLQDALTNTSCAEIWVAEGVYKPGTSTTDSFLVQPGTTLWGGFVGTETGSHQADPKAHVTILSGDIDGDDLNTDGNNIAEVYTDINGDNSNNVVKMLGTTSTSLYRTVIGFTITAGGGATGSGAGLLCQALNPGEKCSPGLSKLVFSGNRSPLYGGGMMVFAGEGATASPVIYDVTFRGNHAASLGGGMIIHSDEGTANPQIQYSTFEGNSASDGGAICAWAEAGISNPTIVNVTFFGNTAAQYGGAIHARATAGALGESNPIVGYSTFSENSAVAGGAIFNHEQDGASSSVALNDVILWNDTASSSSDGYETYSTGASLTVDSSVIKGGCAGGMIGETCHAFNLDTDPKLRMLADNGGYTETMALIAGSSAIDADTYDCIAYDQRHLTRPVGAECDIGAYEGEVPAMPTDFQPDGMTEPTKYVASAGAVYYYMTSAQDWGSAFIGTDGEYVLDSDFDGDGQTDPAKYVDAAGAIWYLGSADDSWHGAYIGSDGNFIPGSDFDGDGLTDPAKYVASAGAVWYLGSSDSTWHGVYIGGLGGGQYVPGSDFDGDGKTDPAHTDSSGNVWYLGSTDSTLHGHFIGNDGPYVPRSDYDGDGKIDPAKFVSPNIWYLQSASAYALTTISLGADTTFVVPGSDFDGDGITDPAKFVDTADAIWYTRSSDAGSVGVYMGADTYEIVN